MEIAPFPFPNLIDLKDSINFNINALSNKYQLGNSVKSKEIITFWDKLKLSELKNFSIFAKRVDDSIISFSSRDKLSNSNYLSKLRRNYKNRLKTGKKDAISIQALNLENTFHLLIENQITKKKTVNEDFLEKLYKVRAENSAIYQRNMCPFI